MKRLIPVYGIFMLFLIVISCKNLEDQAPSIEKNAAKRDTVLTIDYAKKVFERFDQSEKGLKVNSKRKKWKKKPMWQYAKQELLGGGMPVIVTQLDNTDEYPVLRVFEEGKVVDRNSEINTVRKLLVYRDEQGNDVAEIMYVIPEALYHISHHGLYNDADFDGQLIMEDMEGEFKRGYIFKKGKIVGVLAQPHSKNGRNTAIANCFETQYAVSETIDWVSRACANGSCYDQPMYTETKLKWYSVRVCGDDMHYPIATTTSKYTDDDYTRAWLELNYEVKGAKNPIKNVVLTLGCFGTLQQFGYDSRYSFKFIIYNDQPVNGSRRILSTTYDRRVGHTFFALERIDKQTGGVIRKVMGYYPDNKWNSLSSLNVSGGWGDDANTYYDQSIEIEINGEQFYGIIYQIGQIGDNSMYNITGNGAGNAKNCTTMAKFLGQTCFSDLPSGASLTPFGWGYIPSDFGQDIMEAKQKMEATSGVKVNYGALTAPASKGCMLNAN